MKQHRLLTYCPLELLTHRKGGDGTNPRLRIHSLHSGHVCSGPLRIDNPYTTNGSAFSLPGKTHVLE
jgi:hypothetical protein